MSMSHGDSTIGGIEYDGGGYVEKTKKEKVSHQLVDVRLSSPFLSSP